MDPNHALIGFKRGKVYRTGTRRLHNYTANDLREARLPADQETSTSILIKQKLTGFWDDLEKEAH